MRYCLLLFLTLVTLSSVEAQLGRSLQPSWIHLNKPFYVTGDDLAFQLYLAPEFSGEDILVQSILFGANGEPVLYNYWRQAKNHVSGRFQLPERLPTGWYYLSLRAWDKHRQSERVLHQAPLAIYNDQTPISPEAVSQREPARETAEVKIPEKELQIELETIPANPEPGQEVTLTIKVTDRRGRPVVASCSASITDWQLLSTSLAMGMDNLQASDSLRVVTPDRLSSNFYWQGLVQDIDGENITEASFLVRGGQQPQEIRTDNRGRFVYQGVERQVETLDFLARSEQGFQLRFQPAAGRLALGRLFYSPAAFRYLEINRQQRTIRQAMGEAATPEVSTNLVAELPPQFSILPAGQGQAIIAQSRNTNYPEPASISWQPDLQTNTSGNVQVRYIQGWEKTAYRVDVVVQDAEGRRGRESLVYRAPAN